MKPFWASWPSIKRRILSKNKILLLLDFDGTLVPIAKTPHTVILDKQIKHSLKLLCRSDSYRVAIISGRSLKELLYYFNLPGAMYVGNHGLEIRGRGMALTAQAKKARKLEALVWLLAQKLKEDLSSIPGLLIEDKNYTLSIHYRNVPFRYLLFFKKEVSRFRRIYAHWPLVWKEGKKVWEVRPAAQWGKGDAASYLVNKISGAFPIVIGDDVTDEDMFKALKYKGITIRVGSSKKSAAEFYVRSTKEVRTLLEKLSDAKA